MSGRFSTIAVAVARNVKAPSSWMFGPGVPIWDASGLFLCDAGSPLTYHRSIAGSLSLMAHLMKLGMNSFMTPPLLT